MDTINPWLDPIEVRRLADRLMRPVNNPAVTLADAGFDEEFVGYASSRSEPAAEPPAATPPQSPAVEPFQPRPQPATESASTDEPIPATAHGPFLDRIHRFRDWMRENFAATGMFILDREGAVIFDESNHGRLHFLARSLALASRRQGSSSGNVHVKISAGATLEVIPVETTYGWLVLGAVVPESMPRPAVSAVMEALSKIATPPA